MKTKQISHELAAALSALALVACTHVDVPQPPQEEVGTGTTASTGGLGGAGGTGQSHGDAVGAPGVGVGTTMGAGASSHFGGAGGMAGDGGAGGSEAPCNSLPNSGPVVSYQTVNGSPPAMLGGVIPAGTYELVGVELYNVNSNATLQRTMSFAGGSGSYTTELVDSYNGDPEFRANLSTTTAGNFITFTATCGSVGQPATWTYDVDPNTSPVQLRILTDGDMALAIMERLP